MFKSRLMQCYLCYFTVALWSTLRDMTSRSTWHGDRGDGRRLLTSRRDRGKLLSNSQCNSVAKVLCVICIPFLLSSRSSDLRPAGCDVTIVMTSWSTEATSDAARVLKEVPPSQMQRKNNRRSAVTCGFT